MKRGLFFLLKKLFLDMSKLENFPNRYITNRIALLCFILKIFYNRVSTLHRQIWLDICYKLEFRVIMKGMG